MSKKLRAEQTNWSSLPFLKAGAYKDKSNLGALSSSLFTIRKVADPPRDVGVRLLEKLSNRLFRKKDIAM